MNRQDSFLTRRCLLLAPLLPLALSISPSARAQKSSVSNVMPVQSVMPLVAELHSIDMPSQWMVSAQEAQSGQTLAINCSANIHSNDPAGYQIMFRLVPGVVSGATIDFQGSGQITVGSGGQILRRPHPAGSLETVRFSVQFSLLPGVAAGMYAWPIQLAMLPL